MLMSDDRLPSDILFLVAEEDFRIEEPEAELRRRHGQTVAEPSAAAAPQAGSAAASSEQRYPAAKPKWSPAQAKSKPTIAERWKNKDSFVWGLSCFMSPSQILTSLTYFHIGVSVDGELRPPTEVEPSATFEDAWSMESLSPGFPSLDLDKSEEKCVQSPPPPHE